MNTTITTWSDTLSAKTIYHFRLTNATGAFIELTNLGATWVSAYMPNSSGILENILLGYDNAEGYLKDSFYMGATIGRFANRIHRASFSIDGTTYLLEKNDGENTNHGGLSGFSKKIWQWEEMDSGIRFMLHSPDMEGGYPGNVHIEVEYLFSETNELTINYYGISDRPTYLNLTNHAYFNLSGDQRKITEHHLLIPSSRIVETTPQFIPTGNFVSVKGTPFDFTSRQRIGTHLYDNNDQLLQNRGYNHCYILKKQATKKQTSKEQASKEQPSKVFLTAAILSDPELSGRELTVTTDLPGMLLYTSGYLTPTPDIGVCLETQYFPDTPSHPHFPNCLLMPGEEYRHRTVYTFRS